ncbi:MAG: FHA domain-containing protein [Desulfobacteraceae bacterium]|jgi:pSer/pThr/pTyr-binding forkhead associated (FHA) protein
MAKLYILGGPEKGKSFDLESDLMTVGRGSESNVRVRDKSVSRRHLEIVRKGDKYFIKDLKSKNGTYVNDEQIKPGKPFEIGQGLLVAIGKTLFCVGEAYLGEDEDLTTVLDSVDLAKEMSENGTVFVQDRPMTPQRNIELLYKVSHILKQSLNINEILENILQDLLDLLKRIDRGVFILFDEKTGELSDPISLLKKEKGESSKSFSRTIVNRVVKGGKPVVMLDTLNEDEADLSASMHSMKVRSVMCVPLISRSQLRGVIYVDSVNKPYGFRREDLSLLSALSVPAAIAIENASFYQEGDTLT